MEDKLMIDGTELQAIERAVPRAVTPMEMLNTAVQRGADIGTIERLVALQERMMARDAEMQFNAALNRAQAAMGPVSADMTNPQTKSKYASYNALDKKLRPIYLKEGFSLSFDTSEAKPGMVSVICHVSHSAGHTRTYRAPDMPADGKGAKGGDVMTLTHATGAAMSYGQRYLLKFIFNVAIGEDDTDGNAQVEGLDKIESAPTMDALRAVYAEVYKAADGNQKAQKIIIAAKDARRAQLSSPVISADQVKRFQTIASKANATDDDRHKVLKHFGYTSSKDIRVADYDKLCGCFTSGEWAEL